MPDPLKTFLEGAVAPPLPQDGQLPFYPQQRLALDGIQPPSWLWVNEDDFLFLQTRNLLSGVTLQVTARLLEVNGRITTPQFTITPITDGSIVFASVKLYQGYLIGATVTAIGATLPTRGFTYAVLKLQRMPSPSNLTHLILGADYITGTSGLEWPYGRVISPAEGPGSMRSLAGITPAAGADWTFSIGANQRARIRGVSAQLVTSAAVATRRANLIIDDGTNTFYNLNTSVTQLAGLTNVYQWIPGWPTAPALIDQVDLFLPPDLMLYASWRVRSQTDAIQAADQWSAIRVLFEGWLED